MLELAWKREYSLFYGVSALIGLREWIQEDLHIFIETKGEGKDGWFSSFCTENTLEKAEVYFLKEFEKNPEYIPAMKKAIAFITDEGGITSHAAIVAREMNKPCIVGCGNATTSLKDGDSVEIDGNTGVVTKHT